MKLRFESPETVRNIEVKLEGISFSRCAIPQTEEDQRRRKKESYAIEIHKFLYKTQVVFPPREVEFASTTHQFTLPAGEHNFNFSFRIPEYSNCGAIKQPAPLSLSRIVIDSSGVEYARESSSHQYGPLPPALSDMSKIASVRYFLKATVHRTSFLKSNIRIYQPIVYITPDILDSGYNPNEVRFARRQVSLPIDPRYLREGSFSGSDSKNGGNSNDSSKKQGFFKSMFSAPQTTQSPSSSTLNVLFDMRFPTYFNPTKGLPIRLFVMQTSDPRQSKLATGDLYLEELVIKLYATTDTRAQSYTKTHTHSLTLMHHVGMHVALPLSEFTSANIPRLGSIWEVELPNALWEKVRIPDSVAPSFSTCNITRNYSFEVVAGLVATPNARPNYVSVIGEIKLLSGIMAMSGWDAPPREPQVESENKFTPTGGAPKPNHNNNNNVAGDAPPPSYNEVISSELTGSNSGSGSGSGSGSASGSGSVGGGGEALPPPRPPRPGSQNNGRPQQIETRRTFQQSNDYFSNLESFDADTKS